VSVKVSFTDISIAHAMIPAMPAELGKNDETAF
jgi:hypothetical protein